MSEPTIDLFGDCPHCGAQWRDGEFSRLIGMEDPEFYDGEYAWRCPDCSAIFPRFPQPLPPTQQISPDGTPGR